MADSILFPTTQKLIPGGPSSASHDLHLDDVVGDITAPWPEYELAPVFFTPLQAAADVEFRQAVFADIDHASLRGAIDDFTEAMRSVFTRLRGLAEIHSKLHAQGLFLDASNDYCDAVDRFTECLRGADLNSAGLLGVRDHLITSTRSDDYLRFREEATRVRDALHAVRYCLTVAGNEVIIEPYDGESDYSSEVLATFERFRQRDHVEAPEFARARFNYMTHVDAEVLDRVAKLRPEEFAELGGFCGTHRDFVDPAVALFEREIHFYMAMADFTARFSAVGLPLCFPEVSDAHSDSDSGRLIEAHDVYDIALADKLVAERREVVLNDLSLSGDERIIVITGPNQGGKTTFARLFGQLHHFAALGGPVPGRSVRLGLFDRIFTHFERSEDIRNLSGKLEEELIRVHRILEEATSRSVVVMNESFSSTSLADSGLLGESTIRALLDLGLRAVYVTFVDELSTLDASVVSMVSTVDAEDPAIRTYKVVRATADGRAYAICLAEAHGLTASALKERIGQ